MNHTQEDKFMAISELGCITKCHCCSIYNVSIGPLTLRLNKKELHSLFYMLLKTLKSETKTPNYRKKGH